MTDHNLTESERETVRVANAALGRIRTSHKSETSRATLAKNRASRWTPERREAHSKIMREKAANRKAEQQ